MELRHLTTFREVASCLSFTEAAARLGYVQSAVTNHVKALEAELGVPLFDRSGRRIALTDAGSRLLDYGTRIVQLADEAASVVPGSSEPAGTVVVSAPEVLCAHRLPAVIRRLHADHPRVRLVFRSTTTGALDADLRGGFASGDVDVAYVLDEDLESTDALTIEHLADEPLVVVAGPGHGLTRKRSVKPGDLDGEPVLLTDEGCGYRRVFERALAGAGARADVVGEFTSGETVKRCVETGTAIGVLAATSITDELRRGSLVALAWSGPELSLGAYLVTHGRRWVSPAQQALQDATRAVLRQGRREDEDPLTGVSRRPHRGWGT